MGFLQNIGGFLSNVGRGVGNFVTNDIVHPLQRVLPQQPPSAPQQPTANPYDIGQFLSQHLGQAANNEAQQIKVRLAQGMNGPATALAQIPKIKIPIAQQLTGHPTTVGSLARPVANAVSGGAAHLADVINYPINEHIYKQLLDSGQIDYGTYKTMTDQAAQKAGFNLADKGVTVARKSAGAVAGPALAAITADLGPAALGAAKGVLPKIATGAKLGAGVGAAFGGVNTLNQAGPITPLGAAGNVALGAAGGAVLGAAGPIAEQGLKVSLKGLPAAYKNSAFGSEAGYIGQPRMGGKFAQGAQHPDYVNPNDPQAVFNRSVDIQKQLKGDGNGHGLEDQYAVEKQLANNPSLSAHDRLKRNEALEHSDLTKQLRTLYEEQGQLKPLLDKHFGANGAPVTAPRLNTVAPTKKLGVLDRVKASLQDQGGFVAIPGKAEDSTGAEKAMVEQAQNTQAQTKAAIENAKLAPVPYKLPEVKSVNDAVRNMDTTQQLIANRTAQVANLADKTIGKSPASARLLGQALENPDQAASIAAKTKNPQGFLKVVDAHKQLTDFTHSVRQGVGAPVNYVRNYFQHQWDLTDPAKAAEFAKLAQQKGTAAKQRVFSSINEGESAGFNLVPKSAADMIRAYGHDESSAVSKQALVQGLQKVAPDQIRDVSSDTGSLRQNGKAFQQLNTPGLENYHVSPNVFKELHGVVRPNMTNPVAKIADTVNTALKQISLSGGGFHDLNETLRYAGQEIASARPSGFVNLLKARQAFASSRSFEKTVKGWQDSGWLDAAAKSNLSGSQGLDIKSAGGFNIEKLNPLTKGLFDREIRSYKMFTFINEMNKLGVKDGNLNPAQLAQGRKIAAQVNNWYGGINLKIINRSPIVQHALRFTTLAPDFSEGKIRTIGNAATKWGKSNPEGNLARRQVLGNAVTVAVLASAASAAMGQKPQDFFKQLIDPQTKLPYKSPTGKDLIAKLPANPLSDLKRLVTDPGHFATSHMAAVPSVLSSAVQGKDYYGNPLVDPFKNPNPSVVDNLVGAIKSKVPIPFGQASKLNSGKQNLATSVINTLGGRVANDPSSPANQATTQYFNQRDKFVKTLNPNEQALFNTLNPTKKDASGNPVFQSTPLTNPSDYAALLGNPAFLAKYQGYQKSQPSHDPLWDLPANQLRAYMNIQVISKFDPGGDKTTVSQLRAQLPPNLQAQRTAYFNSLPNAGANTASSTTPQAPQMPPDVSAWYNQYKTLPQGTGARSAALKTPQGQKFLAFMQQSDQFTNQQRADVGLPPLTPPTSPYKIATGAGAARRANAATKRVTKVNAHLSAPPKVKSSSFAKLPKLKAPKVTALKGPRTKTSKFKKIKAQLNV